MPIGSVRRHAHGENNTLMPYVCGDRARETTNALCVFGHTRGRAKNVGVQGGSVVRCAAEDGISYVKSTPREPMWRVDWGLTRQMSGLTRYGSSLRRHTVRFFRHSASLRRGKMTYKALSDIHTEAMHDAKYRQSC